MNKYYSLLFLLVAITSGQLQVGYWESRTSVLTPNAIKISAGHQIVSATSGGILIYNPADDAYQTITDKDGLENLDINSMIISGNGDYILGGNSPSGTIQQFSVTDGLIRNTDHLQINMITNMDMNSEYLVASCMIGQGPAVVLFNVDSTGLAVFQDIFNQFPLTVTEIRDIDIDGETIYLVVDSGILSGNINDILNFSQSWNIMYENHDSYRIAVMNSIPWFIGSSGIFFYLDEDWIPVNLDGFGQIIDAEFIVNTGQLSILTGDGYYEADIDTGELIEVHSMDLNSKFVCMDADSQIIALGIKNHGFRILDRTSGIWTDHIPNTMITNRIHSLYYGPDRVLYGHVNDPAFVAEADRVSAIMMLRSDGIFEHIISENTSQSFSLNDNNSSSFTAQTIDWLAGGAGSGGITFTDDDKILVGINGILPNNPDRNGGVVVIDPFTLDYTVVDTSNGILDGQNGIVDNNSASGFISIHGIKKDSYGNDWIINPYSERLNHPAAIRKSDGGWAHITAPDEESYLPQAITFDKRKRAWIAFRKYQNWSSGGIKVVDTRLTYDNDTDDIWYNVSFGTPPPGESVWELEFDQMGLLWIITGGGIQGYRVTESGSEITLIPILPINYFTYLPFGKGDKIVIDDMDNKWIITRHSGIRVITESTLTWPDDQGFTISNSPLLSNIVYDAVIDDEDGIAYFATEKGISTLKLLSDRTIHIQQDDLGISPNPFDPSSGSDIIINGCPVGAEVVIMTISGKVLASLKAEYLGLNSTQAVWDGRISGGKLINSGVYLVTAFDEKGYKKSAKLAVIRQ